MQKLQVETYHLPNQQHKSIEKSRHFSGNFSLILFLKNWQGSCRFFKPFLQSVPKTSKNSSAGNFQSMKIPSIFPRLVKKFLLNDDLQLLCHQHACQPRVAGRVHQKENVSDLPNKRWKKIKCASLDLQWCKTACRFCFEIRVAFLIIRMKSYLGFIWNLGQSIMMVETVLCFRHQITTTIEGSQILFFSDPKILTKEPQETSRPRTYTNLLLQQITGTSRRIEQDGPQWCQSSPPRIYPPPRMTWHS